MQTLRVQSEDRANLFSAYANPRRRQERRYKLQNKEIAKCVQVITDVT